MAWNLNGDIVRDGDLAQLVGLGHKNFIIRIRSGDVLHTHRGVIKHDDLIGLPWGIEISSHNGRPFFILEPSIADLLRDLPRSTQILYPKDVGYILMTMGVGPGQHIVEAGTGSGGLTGVLAYMVGEKGHVTTYEVRQEFQNLAINNITRLDLADRVTFILRDITEGFTIQGADALFLDLPNPFDYMHHVRKALKPGGFFGCILPTVNQVARQLTSLRENNFAFIDVCEILLRYYKPEPDRLRPVDRMVSHTGFLIFARPIIPISSTSEVINRAEVDDDLTELDDRIMAS